MCQGFTSEKFRLESERKSQTKDLSVEGQPPAFQSVAGRGRGRESLYGEAGPKVNKFEQVQGVVKWGPPVTIQNGKQTDRY